MKTYITALTVALAACSLPGKEFHVSTAGDDRNSGSGGSPLKTISAAAQVAQPGDVITVHEGVYRERIDPPRGGTSSDKRIVYRAAEGEKVVLKGSEVVTGWRRVQGDTWKVTLPESFFGKFNPFTDVIRGDWFSSRGRVHHTGAVYVDGHWLNEAARKEDVLKPVAAAPLWYASHDNGQTTIWAQFKGVEPNKGHIEVNARRTVFYPAKPGVNYITVQGLTLEQAATPWSPPTAEQIGLIGTHWSKGWIIENNTIRYSVCVGVTLGKYGDKWDNRAGSAEGYVGTIKRALAKGWSKANIGHHVVRNNHISSCEQGGIVGSMGAVFSTVSGNEIHDIHRSRTFSGAEIAGIKFHGAIDTVIAHNHIYRCSGHGGIWLDWMTQGTRVTGNLLHDNSRQDLFVEVNHGPFLVDNNVFLSRASLLEASGGGAYVHNLFAGTIRLRPERSRATPFHKPHSTAVAGRSKVVADDERFHNNLFLPASGLATYGKNPANLQTAGNVFLGGAKPSANERGGLLVADAKPATALETKPDGLWLAMPLDPAWVNGRKRHLVTTASLGKAMVSGAAYEKPDATAYRLDTDYAGQQRDAQNPAPGPFRCPSKKAPPRVKVWPKNGARQPSRR